MAFELDHGAQTERKGAGAIDSKCAQAVTTRTAVMWLQIGMNEALVVNELETLRNLTKTIANAYIGEQLLHF